MNLDLENDSEFRMILNHTWENGSLTMKAQYCDNNGTYEVDTPFKKLRDDEPLACAKYIREYIVEKRRGDQPLNDWAKTIIKQQPHHNPRIRGRKQRMTENKSVHWKEEEDRGPVLLREIGVRFESRPEQEGNLAGETTKDTHNQRFIGPLPLFETLQEVTMERDALVGNLEEAERIEEQNERLEIENKRLTGENKSLAKEGIGMKLDNERLATRIREITEEAERTKAEKQTMNANALSKIQKMTEEAEQMRREKQELTEEVKRNKGNYEQIKKEKQKCETKNERLERENERLQQQIQKMTEETEQMRRKKEKMIGDTRRIKGSYEQCIASLILAQSTVEAATQRDDNNIARGSAPSVDGNGVSASEESYNPPIDDASIETDLNMDDDEVEDMGQTILGQIQEETEARNAQSRPSASAPKRTEQRKRPLDPGSNKRGMERRLGAIRTELDPPSARKSNNRGGPKTTGLDEFASASATSGKSAASTGVPSAGANQQHHRVPTTFNNSNQEAFEGAKVNNPQPTIGRCIAKPISGKANGIGSGNSRVVPPTTMQGRHQSSFLSTHTQGTYQAMPPPNPGSSFPTFAQGGYFAQPLRYFPAPTHPWPKPWPQSNLVYSGTMQQPWPQHVRPMIGPGLPHTAVAPRGNQASLPLPRERNKTAPHLNSIALDPNKGQRNPESARKGHPNPIDITTCEHEEKKEKSSKETKSREDSDEMPQKPR